MSRTRSYTATITPRALTEPDAARYLSVSIGFLRAARIGRGSAGPAFVRVGARGVRYLIADLDAFMESRRVGGARA